jgi:hypothetical protein
MRALLLMVALVGCDWLGDDGKKSKAKARVEGGSKKHARAAEPFRPPTVTPAAPPAGKKKHALVIVVDTLRADAVEAAKTPNLDQLARDGDRVPHAWSPSTWTAPSVMSMFTGMSLRQHGWNFPFPNKMRKRGETYPRMREDTPTLAEVLYDAGFHTEGWYANPFLGHDMGYDRGFGRWQRTRDGTAVKKIKRSVKGWEDGERHFIYMHLFGPHMPLAPRGAAAERWQVDKSHANKRGSYSFRRFKPGQTAKEENYRRAYHAVVEQVDKNIGKLVRALGPHRDDTAIFITSDHGELLGEHEVWGHGEYVWEQLTHVPFYAVGAGELPDTLMTASLPALVTDSLGVQHTWPVGRDDALPLVSQRGDKFTISPDGRHKATWDAKALADQGGVAVFDLTLDRAEGSPLEAPPFDPLATRAAWEAATGDHQVEAKEGEMGDELLDMLDELGYVED